MATQPASGRDVLEKYQQSDPKYVIAPVPDHVDRSEATRFVCDYATTSEPVGQFNKLGALAVFHRLTGTVSTFEKHFAKREKKPDDYRRSAIAVATVAWIGDDAQVVNAQRYYRAMLGWTPVEPHVPWMTQACDALGPREGTERYKKWIEDEIAKLQKKLAEHEQKEQEQEATNVRRRIAGLKDGVSRDVAELNADNEARTRIDGLNPGAIRGPRLIELYVDTASSSERQSYWAAIRLLRLSESDRALREEMGREFIKAAQRYLTPADPERQPEYELNRARCLRAAKLFGATPDEKSEEWLGQQEDAGTDVLALRPNWEY